MRNNSGMHRAQNNEKDEFYTKLCTIEEEIVHYKEFLKGRHIYCNCDNPAKSNFWRFFREHFFEYGLMSLTSTFYGNGAAKTTLTVKDGMIVEETVPLRGDGDYNSEECREILKDADIVITNPPFSKTREFISVMYEFKKDFIILGNQNVLTYKNVYPHVLDNTLRYGISIRSGDTEFEIPPSYDLEGNSVSREGRKFARVTAVRWLTNLNHGFLPQKLNLHDTKWNLENNRQLIKRLNAKYGNTEYPVYDNYPAREIPFTNAIPSDCEGIMGVPISFFDKFNPSQFTIVGCRKGLDGKDLRINGKPEYFRFLIRKKESA